MARALGSSGAKGIYITPDSRKEQATEELDTELESLLSSATVCQKLSGIEAHLFSIVKLMTERDEGFALLSRRISQIELQQKEDAKMAKDRTDNAERVVVNTMRDIAVPLDKRLSALEKKTLWQRIFRWRE